MTNTLRQIAEAATDARVRRDKEVDEQEITVIELSRQLRSAERVLAELRSDRDDAEVAETTAWVAVRVAGVVYVNVNEDGEDYDRHATLTAARAVQDQFPNDHIEVRPR